jgi:hypothetical protein
MPPPHGSHDLHRAEYEKARRTVGIIDFERILREIKTRNAFDGCGGSLSFEGDVGAQWLFAR